MLSAAVTVPGRRRRIVGLAFATPALVAVSLFILLPGLLALVGSLFNIRIGSQTSWRWAGLDNYGTVLADPAVRQAILNTLVYSVITVIPGLVLVCSRYCCSSRTQGILLPWEWCSGRCSPAPRAR